MRPGTLAVQLYSVIDALEADRPGTLARLAALGFRHVEPFALGLWNTPPDELAATARALRADLDEAGLGVSSVHIASRPTARQPRSRSAASSARTPPSCRFRGSSTVSTSGPWRATTECAPSPAVSMSKPEVLRTSPRGRENRVRLSG